MDTRTLLKLHNASRQLSIFLYCARNRLRKMENRKRGDEKQNDWCKLCYNSQTNQAVILNGSMFKWHYKQQLCLQYDNKTKGKKRQKQYQWIKTLTTERWDWTATWIQMLLIIPAIFSFWHRHVQSLTRAKGLEQANRFSWDETCSECPSVGSTKMWKKERK